MQFRNYKEMIDFLIQHHKRGTPIDSTLHKYRNILQSHRQQRMQPPGDTTDYAVKPVCYQFADGSVTEKGREYTAMQVALRKQDKQREVS